ncbi:MAG TPA: glycosyltransferase family 4 protein [Planctomycetaceae bacterium]|nr:glycosyltransferase family 4 protein [Planctomycetaceae bacterium]
MECKTRTLDGAKSGTGLHAGTPREASRGGSSVERPVFGFILMGGAHVGATVRDVRLANELVRRGYPIHAWWALDQPDASDLDPRIPQRLLFHAMRYRLAGRPSRFLDRSGRLMNQIVSYQARAAWSQWFGVVRQGVMRGLLRRVCAGIENDRSLIKSFARQISDAGVTHFLPTLEMFCPFVEAARKLVPQPIKYCVTFQGYEVYANYAREIGLENALYDRIRDTVANSDFAPIVVGSEYGRRVEREVGIPAAELATIPPCIESPVLVPKAEAEALVASHFPGYKPGVPLVAYLGRQDAEKGIDLLLYAAKLCREQGLEFQLLICGPTAHGSAYRTACRQIAEHLRLEVLWGSFVPDNVRSAIFQTSDVVTYVSIHNEPFGMVPVEAAAHGAIVIIDEKSGAGDVLDEVPQAVLRSRAGDTSDYARQIRAALQRRQSIPRAAMQFDASPVRLADRILDHLAARPLQRKREAA